MEKKYRVPLFLILISSLLLLSSCTDKEPQSDTPSQEEILPGQDTKEESESNENPNQEQETKEFEITASNWKFEPSTITVNEGDRVILQITSIDVKHGISINEFGVSADLNPGETVNVEFIADKKGEFLFFCNVFCGSGHSGMEGTLRVN